VKKKMYMELNFLSSRVISVSFCEKAYRRNVFMENLRSLCSYKEKCRLLRISKSEQCANYYQKGEV
jgi:hypothetical protein